VRRSVEEEREQELGPILREPRDLYLVGQRHHERQPQAAGAQVAFFAPLGPEHPLVGNLDRQAVGQDVGDDLDFARRVLDGIGGRLGHGHLDIEEPFGRKPGGFPHLVHQSSDPAELGEVGWDEKAKDPVLRAGPGVLGLHVYVPTAAAVSRLTLSRRTRTSGDGETPDRETDRKTRDRETPISLMRYPKVDGIQAPAASVGFRPARPETRAWRILPIPGGIHTWERPSLPDGINGRYRV